MNWKVCGIARLGAALRYDPSHPDESFNVMLAVAKDKKSDLLFIGGDFNNQPFSAFERVAPKPKQ